MSVVDDEVGKSMVDMRMAAFRLTKVNGGADRSRALSVAITELETAILWLQHYQIEQVAKG